ncbi:MAG: ATP-dependent 6-phosphofructokinase [Acidobacteria bacterium]|nr:ATP-dependent 6-phosphofructokinase [Acidobacteriota bacterium]
MSDIQRIGILTGGGDCPGLNAVIRAVAKSAMNRYSLDVIGIEDGFLGLIQNRFHRLSNDSVSNILTLGGTILGTNNKVTPLRHPVEENGKVEMRDVTDRCLEHIAANRLDALIVIGGDGTMSVASHFVRLGINCIGVPKTIDNDLHGTDITFGFLTAVSIATDALDRVHTTAASHHRVMIVEVMGRNAGWIALHAGVASGSDVILLPEIPYDLKRVCDFVRHRSRRGKRFSIVCVSEGARPKDGQQVISHYDPTSPEPIRLGGIGQKIAGEIEALTGIETRSIVLGHVQRGGSPIPADRVLATEFGATAIDLLMGGCNGRLVVMRRGTITHIPLTEAEGKQRLVPLSHSLISAARDIGTCFGDDVDG